MSGIGSYILLVTAAALLVSILRKLTGSGGMGELVKLLGGVFLAVTVLSPLVKLELPELSWLDDFSEEGQAAARDGEALARDYSAAIISRELEAYILDKAAILGAELTAAVKLDDEGMPVSVILSGEISPGNRAALARIIEQELGLGEEAQIWTD